MERPDSDSPGPFRLADPVRLRALVAEAGLTLAAEEEVPIVWRYPSLEAWWEATNDFSRTLRLLLDGLPAEKVDAVRTGSCERLARYAAADGTLSVPGVARVALATL